MFFEDVTSSLAPPTASQRLRFNKVIALETSDTICRRAIFDWKIKKGDQIILIKWYATLMNANSTKI